jgi:hypothetical protein
MPKKSTKTDNKKKAFIKAYANAGTIRAAAELVGIHRATHYDWLEKDPQYVKDFQQSEKDAADSLEAEARRRAFEGSDTLLIFLLKGFKPERYKERIHQEKTEKHEHTHTHTLKLDDFSNEELEELSRVVGKLRGSREVKSPNRNGTTKA